MDDPAGTSSPGEDLLKAWIKLTLQALDTIATDLPPWFLDNCVKTFEELAKIEPALRIEKAKAPCDAPKQSINKYEIDIDFYVSVRDEIANSVSHKALFLITPARDSPGSGSGFFSALVQSLARDVETDLVTLTMADMENIAEHYARKEKMAYWAEENGIFPEILLEQYEPEIYDELEMDPLDSISIPLKRIVTAPASKSLIKLIPPKGRVILHIPEAGTFTDTLQGQNFLRYISRMVRNQITGLSVMIILTDSENPQSLSGLSGVEQASHMDPEDILGLTELGDLSNVLYVVPNESESLKDLLNSDLRSQQHHYNVDRLQKMTRKLRAIQKGYEEVKDESAMLLPYSELGKILYSELGDFLTEEPGFHIVQCLSGIEDWSDHRAIRNTVREARQIRDTLEFQLSDDSEESDDEQEPWRAAAIKTAREEMLKKANITDQWEKQVADLIIEVADLKVTWEDIEIDNESRKSITQMVKLCHSSGPGSHGILRNASSKGAVLYGPPGTGKTHLARVLAKQSKSVMIHVSAADVLQKWVGESEKFIKALFSVGRKVAPSIIFIDEADALLRMRTSEDKPWQRSMISQFLQDSDGLKKMKRPPFLLLATNNPQDLDVAVLRRIPGRLYIGMPDERSRERIFQIFLKDEHLSPLLDLRKVANMTVGYTGSDIHTLCVNAALICEDQLQMSSIGGTPAAKRVLMLPHFVAAMRRSGPTVHATTLHKFRRFAHEFHPAAESRIMAEERAEDPDADIAEEDFNRERTMRDEFRVEPSKEESSQNGSANPNPDGMKIYQPLDGTKSEIRLLKIKALGSSGEKVECELETVSLTRYPRYTGLSYVWGDATVREDIIMNGKVWSVTRNLERALRILPGHWIKSFPGRDIAEFRVWVDAVCINQDNLAERNQQIQLMRQIYSQAELVMSCLDTGDVACTLTETALEAYDTIFKTLFDEKRGRPRFSAEEVLSYKWLRNIPALCAERGENESSPDIWHAIDYLQSEHAYFRRVWILQEMVMAERLVFVCGSKSIEYNKLEMLGIMFGATPTRQPVQPDFIPSSTWDKARKFQAGVGLSTISIIAGIKMQYRNAREEDVYNEDLAFTILFVATGLLWLGATDPRDYFYGLMGISKLDINVDYNKSVREVYRDFCQYRLSLSRALCPYQQHFLAHFSGVGMTGPQGMAKKHQLPSWAPNFDVGSLFLVDQSTPDGNSAFRQMRKMLVYQIKSTQWTGGGMQASSDVFSSLDVQKPYIDEGYTLHIVGVLLQRVTKVGRFNQHKDGRTQGLSASFVEYCSEVRGKTTKHPTGKPWLLVMVKTLVCDGNQSLKESCLDAHTREQAFVFFMLLAQFDPSEGESPGPGQLSSGSWLPPDSDNFELVYDYFLKIFFPSGFESMATQQERQAFELIWDRGFRTKPAQGKPIENYPVVENMVERISAFSSCPWFETVDGYVGRGPPYMTVGDIVSVVQDCGLPILLRRAADGYNHVGPCWVEGFQDGEASDFVKKSEWLEIR